MKKLLVSVVLLAANIASADYVCETKYPHGSAFGKTVVFSYIQGTYGVSHYGSSRNTYAAEYVMESSGVSLKKVKDESTHQDMPNKLSLAAHSDGAFTLYGLLEVPVTFPAGSCVKFLKEATFKKRNCVYTRIGC